MSFASSHFFILLSAVLFVYWLAPKRLDRRPLLLLASWIFYGAGHWPYLVLLILVTALDFSFAPIIAARKIAGRDAAARGFLLVSVGLNLLILISFKLSLVLPRDQVRPYIPIGISFYTFQSISYIVDVYRGRMVAHRSFMSYALYIAFFPQLIAGPIERARDLLTQLDRDWTERIPSAVMIQEALWLIFWGLIKKLAIADQLAPYTRWAVTDLGAVTAADVWLASTIFILQFLCDFSAYTDMARGFALLFGIRLSENFRFPYFASSPREFWQRWHITLGAWFRDYVYAPLIRRHWPRSLVTILTMTLVGAWHGLEGKFILWGFFWGNLLALDGFIRTRWSWISSDQWARSKACTGWMLVMLAWILSGYLFVAHDLEGAATLLKRSFVWGISSRTGGDALTALVYLAPFLIIETLQWITKDRKFWFNWPWVARCLFVLGLVLFYLGNYASQGTDFIYFAF